MTLEQRVDALENRVDTSLPGFRIVWTPEDLTASQRIEWDKAEAVLGIGEGRIDLDTEEQKAASRTMDELMRRTWPDPLSLCRKPAR